MFSVVGLTLADRDCQPRQRQVQRKKCRKCKLIWTILHSYKVGKFLKAIVWLSVWHMGTHCHGGGNCDNYRAKQFATSCKIVCTLPLRILLLDKLHVKKEMCT